MSWLLFGDLHADAFENFGRDSNGVSLRLKDALHVLSQIEEIAQKEPVSDIVFLGDVFHNKKFIKPEVFNPVYKKFKRLAQSRELHIIVGNHDISGGAITCGSFDFAHIYTQPSVIVRDNIKIALVPYGSTVLPDADVCMGHIEVYHDSLYPIFKDARWRVEHFSKYHRVILGHYHVFKTISNVTYLGSVMPTNWSQKNIHNFYCATFDGVNLKLHRIETPLFIECGLDELDESLVRGNYVRIIAPRSDAPLVEGKIKAYASYVEVVPESIVPPPPPHQFVDFVALCMEWLDQVQIQIDKNLLKKVFMEVMNEGQTS
jgi:DNA repair exonuclease SbcCD nuclease subunit